MLPRAITPTLRRALADRPVVLLHGARQTGKTTLAQSLDARARYLTLDDATTLASATGDPQNFVDELSGPVVLDEVQRAPGLFRTIKLAVDRDRRPGRFLLTGSANVLTLPTLSESLAGRMEIVPLMPLSQAEIEGAPGIPGREPFVQSVFRKRPDWPRTAARVARADLAERLARGGFPEVATRIVPERRAAWFESYVSTILQRDVRDLANIEDLGALPRLLALIASRTAGLLNFADLSRGLSIPQSTVKRYVALLEAIFLVRRIDAWSANIGLRLTKSPKVMLADSGLGAWLVGTDAARLERDGVLLGPALESFVAMELAKQASWSPARPSLLHFRTVAGHEVDLVLEDRSGAVAGIEVRAGAAVGDHDFKGLRVLADAAGDRFVRGVVLYTGSELIPFAGGMHAVPLATLWSG